MKQRNSTVCVQYKCGLLLQLTILIGLSLVVAVVQARELTFITQPIYSPAETQHVYQPLVQYLSRTTGHRIKLITSNGFQDYWNKISNSSRYDIILDSAHFTSYRVKYLGYSVIAKIPDTVSYSLVSSSKEMFLEANDLVGRTLVTQPPPSLAAVRIEVLFPNPMRLPVVQSTMSMTDAVNQVMQGKASAAIVPTPLLKNYPELNVIATTKPVPHMAFSVSPQLTADTRIEITRALLEANRTAAGRQMLKQINFPLFSQASNKTYLGYHRLLGQIWGYAKLGTRD